MCSGHTICAYSYLCIIVKRSSVVCVVGVFANKSSVSSAMWRTVFSLAAESSEHDENIMLKYIFINYMLG